MQHWIFQANPDTFDVDQYIERQDNILWSVNQSHFRDQINPGDRVYIWRAQGKRFMNKVYGIIAEGTISGPPEVLPGDCPDLWRSDSALKESPQLRVPVSITRRFVRDGQVIQAQALAKDPVTSGLNIQKMRSLTNYLITESESKHISRLISDVALIKITAQARTKSGWLLYKTDNPVVESGSRYDDDLETQYQWDSTVRHHARIEAGDQIAVWDGKRLLGVSYISQIETWEGEKNQNRCPFCDKTQVRPRKTLSPTYICGEKHCKKEFDHPISTMVAVTKYKALYGTGWKDLYDLVGREILKTMWVGSERNQDSLRQLKPGALERFLKDYSLENQLNLMDQAQKAIKGGVKYRVAKQRIGQGAFRRQLIDLYGANCAISGPAPSSAIQACHLYSYSAVGGDHHEDGGLLMRADLHALFDAGLLNIDPKSEKVVLSRYLEQFPEYWRFNANPLAISLKPGQKRWLKLRAEAPLGE